MALIPQEDLVSDFLFTYFMRFFLYVKRFFLYVKRFFLYVVSRGYFHYWAPEAIFKVFERFPIFGVYLFLIYF